MSRKLFTHPIFSSNLFTLISGSAIAQAIPFLVSPILSRLYTPYEFGVFGTFFSVVTFISLIVTLRYEVAIVLPKNEESAVNLASLAGILTVFISLAAFLGILAFLFLFPGSKEVDPTLRFLLYFVPILTILIGFYQVLNSYSNRIKKYRSIVNYRLSNSAVTASVNIFAGSLKMGSVGLLLGTIAGSLISIMVFFRELYSEFVRLGKKVTKSGMRRVAHDYREFPLVNSFQAVSDLFQINGIIYFIILFFNTAVVGSFSYAIRILQAPMNLIGSAFAQVFIQQASVMHNESQSLDRIVRKSIFRSAMAGLPVLVVLLLAGPQLFAFVFGEPWRDAGVYARILSPVIFLDFVRAPISQVPLVIGRQKRLFSISLIGNVILLTSMLYGGIVAKDVVSGLALYSILQSTYILLLLNWLYKISQTRKDSND